jgi:hypothetical protein
MRRALSQRALSFFEALPPYPGGKRRLVPAIFGLIHAICPRASWPGLTLADPFLGGGGVALTAKALGFGRVLANDLATRSVIIGRALLENSTTTLTPLDVLQLFEASAVGCSRSGDFLERLPAPLAEFLASAWAHVQGYPPPKVDLARLLLMRWLLSSFPMGLPSATDSWRIRDRDFDPITYRRLHHYLSRERHLLHPRYLLRLAAKINAGVFPGSASVTQFDALALLPQIKGDVAYLDPPYGGTQSYENAYRLLDAFLGDDHPTVSSFSSTSPPIDELLAACDHIPVLVLSMNNAVFSEQELTALVARHRCVERVISIPYTHYGPLASPRKNKANREMLVLSTKGTG